MNPLRVNIRCTSCATVVGSILRAKVQQPKVILGARGQSDEQFLQLGADAAALICPKCEATRDALHTPHGRG